MQRFWRWYEENYKLNIGITTGLFLLQIFHLFWLFSEVVITKLIGTPLFGLHNAPQFLIVLVDYTEIPALLSVSVVYLNELRKKFNYKSLIYLIFINSQWLHLFWITDEFVVQSINPNYNLALPLWLSWIAILIDFLELPVIFDTLKRFVSSIGEQGVSKALLVIKNRD